MNTSNASPKIRRPNRARHSYTQSIKGPPEAVFALCCPVREIDWVPGWNPDWVVSDCGVAEQDCIFQTPADPFPAIWVISRHDPVDFRMEMFKITPGHTVCKLEISLDPDGEGTLARIAYQFTSLGPPGDDFIKEFTADWYENFMRGWESAMNHYLLTGEITPD